MHPIVAKVVTLAGPVLAASAFVAQSWITGAMLAAAPPDGPIPKDMIGQLSDWGVTLVLAWFVYYVTAIRDPKAEARRERQQQEREEQHRRELRDRDEQHRQEMAERERQYREESERRDRRHAEELGRQRSEYLGNLGEIRAGNAVERREYRQSIERVTGSVDGVVDKVKGALEDVADMEKTHAAAMVRLAQTIERNERVDQERKEGSHGGGSDGRNA